jgi:hypothetical protein
VTCPARVFARSGRLPHPGDSQLCWPQAGSRGRAPVGRAPSPLPTLHVPQGLLYMPWPQWEGV